jgi:hypothetical protein
VTAVARCRSRDWGCNSCENMISIPRSKVFPFRFPIYWRRDSGSCALESASALARPSDTRTRRGAGVSNVQSMSQLHFTLIKRRSNLLIRGEKTFSISVHSQRRLIETGIKANILSRLMCIISFPQRLWPCTLSLSKLNSVKPVHLMHIQYTCLGELLTLL